jgi:hypothetical protein
MSKGELYKGRIKPDVISWFEQNLANYWNYITGMTPKAASYLEQTCPVIMNREQTISTVIGDKDFIASNSTDGIPTGLIDEDISRLEKASILLIGRAVNDFNGINYLNCSTATWNQWQINVNGGTYVDLQNNGKADGQMADTDWYCVARGVIHPFTFMFDITGLVTSVQNRFGIRLQSGIAIADSLIITVDIYSKYTWRL